MVRSAITIMLDSPNEQKYGEPLTPHYDQQLDWRVSSYG